MPHPVPPHETRTIEQLREQLAVERDLARRLREAPDTRGLYSAVYDEFLRRVPHHPSLELKEHPEAQAEVIALQVRLLGPFLDSRTRFLEVGGGDGLLARELSRRVAQVTAIEAGKEISAGTSGVPNLTVLLCDSPPYALPDGIVDLAFSSHFIEHLRRDDALLHLREMRRLLSPGGRYVCVTPNRLWGPHDISRYFSDVPEGLHLHEYSHNELLRFFRRAGFRRPRVISRLGAADRRLPHLGYRALEGVLTALPQEARRWALATLSGGRRQPLRLLEQVIVTAVR
jgi:SAM-dependent methyltransferase